MGGTGRRPGLFHCPDCRGQFTVVTGSVMERSHIPLPKWVLAIRLMTASKKDGSAHQIHRSLGAAPIGGEGKIVEADEAYRGKGGEAEKRPIVALVERGGEARVTHMRR